MKYRSINVYLEEHDSIESISKQVCTELQELPIKNDKRSCVVYTHSEEEEIRLVEALISNYKKDLVYKASALVDNRLLLKGKFDVEIDYQVMCMETQEKQKTKKHKKALKKVEKLLMRSLESLTR